MYIYVKLGNNMCLSNKLYNCARGHANPLIQCVSLCLCIYSYIYIYLYTCISRSEPMSHQETHMHRKYKRYIYAYI